METDARVDQSQPRHTDQDILFHWQERAAIREYDGEEDRKTATIEAGEELRKIYGTLPRWVVSRMLRS